MGKCAIIGRECPRTSDGNAKNFCPAWDEHGIEFKDKQNNTIIIHCAFQCIGPCLMHTVQAANRATEAAESQRNATVKEIANGFDRLTKGITEAQHAKLSQNDT